MGRNRNRKAKPTPRDILPQRIALAWKNRHSNWIDYVMEAIQQRNGFDILFEALVQIDPEERHEFSSGIFRQVCHGGRLMPCNDGVYRLALVSLFTVTITGPAYQMQKLVLSPGWSKITRLMRKLGIAHQNSNIVLLGVPIQAEDAADTLMHPQVAKLTSCLVTDTFDQVSQTSADFLRSQVSRETAVGEQVVTRLFVGGRLLLIDMDNASETKDLFEGFVGRILPMSKVERQAAYNPAWLKAKSAFSREATEIANLSDCRGLSITLSLGWTDGLGTMALDALKNGIEREAHLSGIESLGNMEAHIVLSDEDEVTLALKRGTVCLGPVQVSKTLALYGIDMITDWLAGTVPNVVWHDTFQSLMKGIGRETLS